MSTTRVENQTDNMKNELESQAPFAGAHRAFGVQRLGFRGLGFRGLGGILHEGKTSG